MGHKTLPEPILSLGALHDKVAERVPSDDKTQRSVPKAASSVQHHTLIKTPKQPSVRM